MKDPRFQTQIAATVGGMLLGFALIGASAAYAKPDMDIDSRIERMADQFDLTNDQQSQIRTILENARVQREQQRLEVREQIESVLTSEQKSKRDSRLKERMDRRLERMTDRLDLSDEQVAKMKALFEEASNNPDLTKTEVRQRISGILTEEQRSELRDNRRPPHRGDRGSRPDCG
ncbi:Spy/CpxP family protein refolding chaperone [Thiorhodococcus fuscus]|uniref:Spy/CpxP family protein refolding chaperone n=1 Tax=Thiorhodococcus fuscus TaxID=527200 RepID=A0ABW4Y7W2_9GAMM